MLVNKFRRILLLAFLMVLISTDLPHVTASTEEVPYPTCVANSGGSNSSQRALILIQGWTSYADSIESQRQNWQKVLNEVQDLYQYIIFFSYDGDDPNVYSQGHTLEGIYEHHIPLLHNLIDSCRSSLGANVIFDLVGHSMGGTVAFQWAVYKGVSDESLFNVRHIIALHSPVNGVDFFSLSEAVSAWVLEGAIDAQATKDLVNLAKFVPKEKHVEIAKRIRDRGAVFWSIYNSKDAFVWDGPSDVEGFSTGFDLGRDYFSSDRSAIIGHNQIIHSNSLAAADAREHIRFWLEVRSMPIEAPPSNPIQPPEPSLSDNANFTGIESPNDQYIGNPSSQIEKSWRMENTGTSTWNNGYRLTFVSGHQMGAPSEVALQTVLPGQSTDLKINITLPSTPGVYRGNWRLKNPQGTFFGDTIWVQVTVPGSAPAPPPSGPALELSCTNCPVTVTPGQKFQPTIQVKVNSGQLLNSRGDMLRHKAGDRFGAWEHVALPDGAVINPGQTHAFTFYQNDPITAPTSPGDYETTWQVWRNGGWDGPEFKIRFAVVSSGTSNRQPNPPTLTGPGDWAVYHGNTGITLSAQHNGDPDGDAITHYYFDIFDSAQNANSGWITSNSWSPQGLGFNGYQWRAKVRDSRGVESAWSPQVWHFGVLNNEPEIYSFSWMWCRPEWGNSEQICFCADTNAGTLRVQVNSATDGSARGEWQVLNELGVPRYSCSTGDDRPPTWSQLEYEAGNHLVRLYARRDGGWERAAYRDLIITLPSNRRPDSPRQLLPEFRSIVNSLRVHFDWVDTLRTTGYRLEVATDQAFSTKLLDVQVASHQSEYVHTFSADHDTVHWRVTANGPHGSHTATSQFRFDVTPPIATIQPLPTKVNETPFEVRWSGTDSGSGIRWYQIQVKEGTRGDSQWTDWLVNTTSTAANFEGKPGETYAFRVRAMDNIGNWTSWPAENEAVQTTVDLSSSTEPGVANLAVTGFRSYYETHERLLIEAQIQNVGDRSTENGFYIDLYANRQPTGPGDYTGSLRYWVNSALAPGEFTTVSEWLRLSSPAMRSELELNEFGELNASVYLQADSSGVVQESTKEDNISGITLCYAAPDTYEGNDSLSEATTLNLEQAQQHNLATRDDEDWFKFTATAAGTYVVRTFDLGPSADTYLYLYAPNGTTLLAENDDHGNSLASQIEWEVSTPGTYYLRVRQWNANQIGCGTSYSIEVTRATNGSQLYLPAINTNPATTGGWVNGDFEQGPTVGWARFSRYNYPLIYNRDVFNVYEGQWGAWLGGDNDELAAIWQVVTVPYANPVMGFYRWLSSQDACGYDHGIILINQTEVADYFTICAETTSSQWQLYTVDLSAYRGQTVDIEIRVQTNGSHPSNMFFDYVHWVGSPNSREIDINLLPPGMDLYKHLGLEAVLPDQSNADVSRSQAPVTIPGVEQKP